MEFFESLDEAVPADRDSQHHEEELAEDVHPLSLRPTLGEEAEEEEDDRTESEPAEHAGRERGNS